MDEIILEEQHSPGRFVLPALAVSNAVAFTAGLVVNILLVDIAQTFDQPVGVVGQLQTVASLVGAVTALTLVALSVRFSYKVLLLVGLTLFCLSAVGSFFAPNFAILILFFSLSGIGMAMIQPMIFALIGTLFSLEKRPGALGIVNAGASLSMIFGAPIIGYIAVLGDWRWTFLGFVLPVSLLGLSLAAKGIAPIRSPHPPEKQGTYWAGFKAVFASRSALACLVGNALAIAGGFGIQVYAVTFVRERFDVAAELASILAIVAPLAYILGTLVTGRFITRFGWKPVTGFTGLGAGICLIAFTNVPILMIVVVLWFVLGLFFAMMMTTAYSVTLEQVPSFRGSMMSINSAAANVGSALGAGVGGLVLLWWDYEFVGLTLGVMVLAATTIYYLVVRDPTKTGVQNNGT
jgi:predicted MFS family arabinose efflux permease